MNSNSRAYRAYSADSVYNRTFQCLSNLYLNSRDMQDECRKDKENNGELYFSKTFCTIRLCGPRRSGHSMAILRFLSEYNLISHIILPNLRMVQMYQDYIDEYEYCPLHIPTFHSVHVLDKLEDKLEKVEMSGVDCLIMDVSCLLSNADEARIYKIGHRLMFGMPYRYYIFME